MEINYDYCLSQSFHVVNLLESNSSYSQYGLIFERCLQREECSEYWYSVTCVERSGIVASLLPDLTSWIVPAWTKLRWHLSCIEALFFVEDLEGNLLGCIWSILRTLGNWNKWLLWCDNKLEVVGCYWFIQHEAWRQQCKCWLKITNIACGCIYPEDL